MQVNLDELKNDLFTKNAVRVANATYSLGQAALGDLEQIGAGQITRRRVAGHKVYGFRYHSSIDNQPLRATLLVGSHRLRPGDSFEDEV